MKPVSSLKLGLGLENGLVLPNRFATGVVGNLKPTAFAVGCGCGGVSHSDSVVLWICGSVFLWICGSVDLWFCGSVDLWFCGSVDLWYTRVYHMGKVVLY